MKPESARAWLVAGALFILLGAMVGSPVGGVALVLVGAVMVLGPALGGERRARLVAAGLVLLALSVVMVQWRPAQEEMGRYLDRAAARAEGGRETNGSAKMVKP